MFRRNTSEHLCRIASCGAQVCQEKLRLSEEKAAEVVGHFWWHDPTTVTGSPQIDYRHRKPAKEAKYLESRENEAKINQTKVSN